METDRANTRIPVLWQCFFPVLCALLCIACQSGKQKESDPEIQALVRTGAICKDKGRPDSSLLCSLTLLQKLDPQEESNYGLIANQHNNAGDIFYNANMMEQALEQYQQAIAYGRKLGVKDEESRARRGVWRCYASQGSSAGDSVIARAIPLIPDISSRQEVAALHNNLTGYYLFNNHLDKAFEANSTAIRLCTDSIHQFQNYSVRSQLFIRTGQLDSAWVYASLASRSPDIYTRATALYRLSSIAEENRCAKANHSPDLASLWKTYSQAIDSVYQAREADSLQSILHRQQISHVQKEVEKDKRILIGILVTLLVTSMPAFVLWKRWQNKKIRQEQNEQRDFITKQFLLEEWTAARKQGAENFQRTSLSREIATALKQNATLNLQERTRLKNELIRNFNTIPHLLSNQLSASEEDVFLYCLSAAGFGTKECAACRCVTESAIRMQRKRLNDKIRKLFNGQDGKQIGKVLI